MNYDLTDEERNILERFERGELRTVADAEHEMEMARQAARNTLNKIERTDMPLRQQSSVSLP